MIPKILHHVWPGKDPLREPYAEWRKGWIDLHPDWTLIFWRERDLLSNARLWPQWVESCSVVVRADLVRWTVLLVHGGVYVDADMECIKALDPLLDCAPGMFLAPEPVGGVLSPALVGAERGHRLAAEMISAVRARIEEHGAERCSGDPVHTTGPALLTEVARGRADVQIHPPYFFCPSPREGGVAYARHHFTGSNDPAGWRNRRGKHNFGEG